MGTRIVLALAVAMLAGCVTPGAQYHVEWLPNGEAPSAKPIARVRAFTISDTTTEANDGAGIRAAQKELDAQNAADSKAVGAEVDEQDAVTLAAKPKGTGTGPYDLNPQYPPVRPTYRDVSIKFFHGEDTYSQESTPPLDPTKVRGQEFSFIGGLEDGTGPRRLAKQPDRDAMQFAQLMYAEEALRYCLTNPSCATSGAVAFGLGYLSEVLYKLGPNYEQKNVMPIFGGTLKRSEWFVNFYGRHYRKPAYVAARVQSTSLSASPKNNCATNPLMTEKLRDFLDLRLVDGRCVSGANFKVPMPNEPYNDRSHAGVFRGILIRPTDPADVDGAHMRASDAHCGGRPSTPGEVTRVALAFEATATSEDERHAFMMQPFSGVCVWDAQTCCTLSRMADFEFHGWRAGLAEGNWPKARARAGYHQIVHAMMGLKGLSGRLDCVDVNNCAIVTTEQAVANFRATHPEHLAELARMTTAGSPPL